MATYKGKTEDAGSPILGAAWWEKGKSITGRVMRSFKTVNGECYELRLLKPVEVGEEKSVDRVSVGALKGFMMALAAGGLDSLLRGDGVFIECTGVSKTDKGHDRVNFQIEVTRIPGGEITDEDVPF